MRIRSTPILCSIALLIGLVVGAAGDVWPFLDSVRADLFNTNSVDNQYRELEAGGRALIDASQLLAKIAALTTPSVVHIQSVRTTSYRRRVEETGSGVVIQSAKSPGFYIVTNRHVVAEISDLDKIAIHLHDGRVLHPVRIWTDPASDVAVMKVTANDLQPARWGDSDKVRVGHMVLAMGSPFGLSHSVTFGIVSAKGRRSLQLGGQDSSGLINQDFLQTDAAINPGNSGGPLIDLQGRVIGINTAIASNGGGNEGIGFSIPSNLVRRFVDELLEHNHVERAYLGVTLDPDFDVETAARLELDRPNGTRVQDVHPNTPASRANLKRDDVIISFDGIDVQDVNHLINLVSLSPVGKTVQMVVVRGGKKLTIEVVLSGRPDSFASEPRSKTAPGVLPPPVEPR